MLHDKYWLLNTPISKDQTHLFHVFARLARPSGRRATPWCFSWCMPCKCSLGFRFRV